MEDKDYQEALIDTFLVAAYLYDDRVKFVFTLGKDRGETTIPFKIDDIDLEGVRIRQFGGAVKCLGEPFGCSVIMINDLFVFEKNLNSLYLSN